MVIGTTDVRTCLGHTVFLCLLMSFLLIRRMTRVPVEVRLIDDFRREMQIWSSKLSRRRGRTNERESTRETEGEREIGHVREREGERGKERETHTHTKTALVFLS